MPTTKTPVKRQLRPLVARDLMKATGGAPPAPNAGRAMVQMLKKHWRWPFPLGFAPRK